MKCHYTYDEEGNKHFIPMCWGTVHSNDIEDCICPEPDTDHQFEKERFNKVVKEKNEIIKNMQAEINHLRKVIKTLKDENTNPRTN